MRRRVPKTRIAELRSAHPRLWQNLQACIELIVAYPPSILAEQLRAAGREGAIEILEAMLDRGDLKLDATFDPKTHDIVSFGLALYEPGLRKYVIMAEEVGAQEEGDDTGEFDEDDDDHATGGFDDE